MKGTQHEESEYLRVDQTDETFVAVKNDPGRCSRGAMTCVMLVGGNCRAIDMTHDGRTITCGSRIFITETEFLTLRLKGEA